MAHSHDHASHSSHEKHDHDHSQPGHSHAPASYGTAFAVGTALNSVFVLAELAYGFSANSLALLADAVHNLGDVLGLVLSWIAASFATRAPTQERTYGFGRGTILASLINAVILLVSIGGIGVEAVQRWMSPQPVAEGTVMWVAAIGIVINGATALLFMRGRSSDLNIRSAFVHMAADAGISFGVVIAAIAISKTGWIWLDPVTSLAIAVIIGISTWSLLTHSINLSLDAVPGGIDAIKVGDYLRGLAGVRAIHDLHIWALSTTSTALTAHLVCDRAKATDEFLAITAADLKKKFGIDHATMQIENGDDPNQCLLAPDHVV